MSLVKAQARALAELGGFAPDRVGAIELVCEEAFGLILERVSEPGHSQVRIDARLGALALELAFDDREIPPLEAAAVAAAPTLDRFDFEAASRALIRGIADAARWQPLGRQGNRLALVFNRPVAHISESAAPGSLERFDAQAPLAPEQAYHIRVAGEGGREGDWVSIARAMYRAYGFTYLSDDFYVPARIRALNHAAEVVSIVAEAENGDIVGHYALDMQGFGATAGEGARQLAEIGKAVVDPAHRGRGLMERMRAFTEAHARDLGLQAVFSEPTMAHPYSQRTNERLGAHACGVNIALVGVDMDLKSIEGAGQGERTSVLVYIKPLVPPVGRRIHPPALHRDMVLRTYRECGIPAQPAEPAGGPLPSESGLEVAYVGAADFGVICVHRVGGDLAPRLRAARDELVRRAGTRVIYLSVRLTDPGCPRVQPVAEGLGFFYSGLGPHFDQGHDVLRWQYIDVPVDFEALNAAGPFARAILDYVAADRQRVEHAPG